MKKLAIISQATLVALALSFSSCKDDEKKPDCGCDGTTELTIDKANAAYVGDGYFAIERTNEGNEKYLLAVKACGTVDASWEVAKDSATFNYTVSGDVKKQCKVDDVQPNTVQSISFQLKELIKK
ncbi:hypothetical protein SAMN05216327_106383 [Dyadobacter sp. SG02]|uniref:hypothetical protein n=1 Tax=Dyadobacter sp. SG02 TaxID=1855291 RepID=UPI0008CA828C|nr:hypothetical protein [Dyadobacter sp. SG02]SEJ15668.1 hypothetical protein SAMN05216327_106383 [Dyadobacter sp. SG02]